MSDGFKSEHSVRRFFRDRGFEIIRVRHNRHWVVHARLIGCNQVTRFVLSTSTTDPNMMRIVEGDLKRAAADRNNNTVRGE